METKQPFKALSKICLNNWHYIDRKILTFSEGVNFFTGHSGSGKSTVIDALQIVLYANTDGRGFFNKAAADDSDRSLIEYLRGMVNIGDNNEFQYLRNQNFSSTIVLEFRQTDTGDRQCAGVVFDVDTSTNEISRLFFWHKGGLLPNGYRADRRCLTTGEVREYLQRTFDQDEFYCGPSNERFRKQLYDIYLGGLDTEKFPRLFKRAIPFRMNIKLEDFVKEYICMEQDIHIEDLQESVMQYGRMRGKIEETIKEIHYLEEIREKHAVCAEKKKMARQFAYYIRRLDILQLNMRQKELQDRADQNLQECSRLETMEKRTVQEQEQIRKAYEEIIVRIAESGYAGLEKELENVCQTLERLVNSRAKWQRTAEGLSPWKSEDIATNQMIWDIESFEKEKAGAEILSRLKDSLETLRKELEEELKDIENHLRLLKKEEKDARGELKELRQGRKAYPRAFEEARFELRNRLQKRFGKVIPVHVLADMLDVRDETWHNAVEGYMGRNKLLLVTEPAYAKAALEIYREMDREMCCCAAVLDTEKVQENAGKDGRCAKEGSLAGEVIVQEEYLRAYVDSFLGAVMKCETMEQLRSYKTAVTSDCMVYQGYRLRHMNPEEYTRHAYIGEKSMRGRIRRLEDHCNRLQEERIPLQEQKEKIQGLLRFEFLSLPEEEYEDWLKDIREISAKEKKKEQIRSEMKKLQDGTVSVWEEQKRKILLRQEEMKERLQNIQKDLWKTRDTAERCKKSCLDVLEEIKEKQKDFRCDEKKEEEFKKFLSNQKRIHYDSLKKQCEEQKNRFENEGNLSFSELVECRTEYMKAYPNRSYSATDEGNSEYDKLLNSLQCDNLEHYREAAKEQARSAAEHFKDDFIFKIRSAIREAYQRQDELNRIISRLDFGKDKYRFVITKNKGPDGRFYKMFMDDALSINPAQLGSEMENQMNLFTMEHEEEYGDMMNELIHIFIPPENASREELEEARRNMVKYADYRTYLSFDMQQIIKGEKEIRIGLSRMISKNSGGEGQNPLYIALLASFAQIYRINMTTKIRRPATLRLVVLDEAFSKMDAEKVASCISLMRGLGFQAIISATNDKIQNYIENVDKTFVYANPDKTHISIQEFERTDYDQLRMEEEKE